MANDIWGDDLDLFLKVQNLPDSAFKPCPKCGSTWITRMAIDLTGKYTSGPSFFVGCLTCDCRTANLNNPMEVVKKWNNREVFYPQVTNTISRETNKNENRSSVMKKLTNIFKKGIATIATVAVVCTCGFAQVGKNVLAYNAGIEAFVNSLYSDCLGRSADPTGFNDWCNKLATGQISGKQAAYGFFFSPEFQAKANSWSDTELINAYYKVFLNRGSDPQGASYWAQQIAGTTNDISILFTGFADSTEFASKCASYGVTVGNHIDVPTTVRGSTGGSMTTPPSGGASSSGLAGQTNGRRASSPEELDAYWTNLGYEIFYIDLGNGNSQKCYARFFDMTDHNNRVNAWRNQNGLPSLNVVTDPDDPRVAYTRMRAVEVAYSFAHKCPAAFNMGLGTDPHSPSGFNGGENISNGLENDNGRIFTGFQNSTMHNRAMLWPQVNAITTASCEVNFVQPDGVSIYVTAENYLATPTELPGYSGGLPAGTTMGTVQEFWE